MSSNIHFVATLVVIAVSVFGLAQVVAGILKARRTKRQTEELQAYIAKLQQRARRREARRNRPWIDSRTNRLHRSV